MSRRQGTDGGDLTAELALLVEERAVLRTLYSYGHSIDYGLEEEWLDCFTADAVFDVRHRVGDRPSRRHEGREALARFVAQHTRAPDRWHKHLLIEPVVTIDGDRATVRSYFTRLDATADGAPVVHAFGRYFDELIKEPDGKWRFTERVAEIEAVRWTPTDPT